MRVMLDANVLLDCLVLETSGQARPGKDGSERLLNLCDSGVHQGLVAWHTLPIIAYYHAKQNASEATSAMMDELLLMLEVPTVGQPDATDWRSHGIHDFEDALQMACALSGRADVFITRNTIDFVGVAMPVMTPEEFLAAFP
ncbi:MAG TPA: hypothetical protein DIT64_18725 [Verrucomicrobiales bacterium]|nr:hypothetical protein [Verrucomicrobiales bacterium]HRJ08591.1 PIN domain-containing protein [Prosthecobacter sp.]HRK16165.1 PIN domain-containing protein [Prosthecobacter sp.]